MQVSLCATTRDWQGAAQTIVCGFRQLVVAALLPLVAVSQSFGDAAAEPPQPTIRLIGATTVITEVSTGLPFSARVDTGATTCSIHCEAVEIEEAHDDPRKNIGKPIRFLVTNKDGDGEWVKSKIVDYVTVRTSQSEEERYKVRMRLRWEDLEKRVHVTLNDRSQMTYPLLLGRNFLRDDFLVNVSLDSDE